MALLLLAGVLLAAALALPATPGVSLVRRYRWLAGQVPAPPSRRTIPAWIPGRQLAVLLPRRYREGLQLQLTYAHLHDAWPLTEFVALKVLLSAGLGLLLALLWLKNRSPVFGLYTVFEFVAGWTLPDFWVKRRATACKAAIGRELPHLLSSLAICLQTGLSLRSALLELGAMHRDGVLGQELGVVASQLGAGASPHEALRALTERCGTPELTQAVGVVLQHAEKGSSAAGNAVAAESRLAWQRRRRRAESVAQSASLKLFLPQLVLNLPALVLVLLGPAVLGLLAAFNTQ